MAAYLKYSKYRFNVLVYLRRIPILVYCCLLVRNHSIFLAMSPFWLSELNHIANPPESKQP